MTDALPPGWQTAVDLPTDLKPTRLIPLEDGLLICGWRGAADVPAGERRAVILKASTGPEPLLLTRYEADGWIASADLALSGVGHAIRIKGADGTVSRDLLCTDDGGVTWVDQGPIGGSSAMTVLSLGPTGALVQGAGALLVSRDAGATWRVLDAPGPRDPFGDRLYRMGDRVLLATAEGTFVTVDGGRTWGRRPLGPVHVRAIDGSYIAARAGSETLLGQPRQGQVRWFARFETDIDPIELRVAGPRVQMLALRLDPDDGPLLVLIESTDDAATFSSTRLGVPPDAGRATLTEHGAVYAVDLAGRLLVRPWLD